jgi:hypothetical protein
VAVEAPLLYTGREAKGSPGVHCIQGPARAGSSTPSFWRHVCGWVGGLGGGGSCVASFPLLGADRHTCECVCPSVCSRRVCPQIVFSGVKEGRDADGLTVEVDSFAMSVPWTLRADSSKARDAWLAALLDHRASLYMNGTLQKRGKVTRQWKQRYVLLVGPDLHWSKGESKRWLGKVGRTYQGTVRVCACVCMCVCVCV